MTCTNKQQETCEVEKRGCNGCAYREKTADEMFEELGYKKIENKQQINYVGTVDNIVFLIRYKKIEYNFLRGSTFRIQTMQELQAINKKVQELGWKG